MNTFSYKGKTVNVYNDGGRVPVNFVEANTPDPVKFLSGNRIEFAHGAGNRWIYQVLGLLYDETTFTNRVQCQAIFVTTLPDGTEEVIKKYEVSYAVNDRHFQALSSMPSLAGSTILGTLAIHLLNGLLCRIPELGGSPAGRGLELFNNDGTVDTPLFTYTRESKLTEGGTEEVIVTAVPVRTGSFKLLVNGLQNTYPTETSPGLIEDLPSLTAGPLADGFYQFTLQEVDAAGTVIASQVRNILV